MINKKQLIEELLECVKDATDTETQITGLSMCAILMNEVLDEALTIPVVVVPKGTLPNNCKVCGRTIEEMGKMTSMCGVSACPNYQVMHYNVKMYGQCD